MTYSRQRFEAEVVASNSLDLVASGVAPVAVHYECDMSWDWTLAEGADGDLAGLLQEELDGRAGDYPAT